MSGRVEIVIDDPGNTEEVEVASILVGVGDAVVAGQALLEVETDKANMELEAPAAGVVAEILVEEGAIVPVAQVFMVVST
jgi:pyruvate/2-oxoglutarate dehydrogenase complex dihydrolipoamide acyltransferase (E2) component